MNSSSSLPLLRRSLILKLHYFKVLQDGADREETPRALRQTLVGTGSCWPARVLHSNTLGRAPAGDCGHRASCRGCRSCVGSGGGVWCTSSRWLSPLTPHWHFSSALSLTGASGQNRNLVVNPSGCLDSKAKGGGKKKAFPSEGGVAAPCLLQPNRSDRQDCLFK